MTDKHQTEEKFKSKETILLMILENKELLFGKGNKEEKEAKWTEIVEVAKNLELVPSNRNWMYMRDTVWPNYKKSSWKKAQNIARYGIRDGKRSSYLNENDNIVLEILKGKFQDRNDDDFVFDVACDESIHNGFYDPSLQQYAEDCKTETKPIPKRRKLSNSNEKNNYQQDSDSEIYGNGSQHYPVVEIHHHGEQNNMKHDNISENLQHEQLKLTIENMKLQNYKLKLECLQIERALRLPTSEFTKEFSEI